MAGSHPFGTRRASQLAIVIVAASFHGPVRRFFLTVFLLAALVVLGAGGRGLWWVHQPLRAAAPTRGPVDRARHLAARRGAGGARCRRRRRPATAVPVVPPLRPGPRRSRPAATSWSAASRRGGCWQQAGARRGSPARLTLVEGWNFRQVRAALAKAEQLKPDTAGLTDEDADGAAGPAGRASRRPLLPRHLHLCQGLQRRRRAAARACAPWTSGWRRLGASAAEPAAEDARRGADPGQHRRKGDRQGRRPARWSPPSSTTGCAWACRCRPTRP